MFQWLGRALERLPWFRAYQEDRLRRLIDSGFLDDSLDLSKPVKPAPPEQYSEANPVDVAEWSACQSPASANPRRDD